MEPDKIYFDMDGVLADFTLGVKEMCGIDIDTPQEQRSKEQDKAMFDAIHEVPDFYLKLKTIPGTVDLFYRLRELYGDKVEVLTGIPKPERNIPTASDEKISWVRDHLEGDIVVNTVLRSEKKNYVKGEGSILIDDLPSNIKAWEECGGTGILFKDPESAERMLEELGVLPED